MICLGGMKLPVTPMRRSARSFRADRPRAARLMSGGHPTTAPITRSTIHLPPNSLRRARVVLRERAASAARASGR